MEKCITNLCFTLFMRVNNKIGLFLVLVNSVQLAWISFIFKAVNDFPDCIQCYCYSVESIYTYTFIYISYDVVSRVWMCDEVWVENSPANLKLAPSMLALEATPVSPNRDLLSLTFTLALSCSY